jgi:hypothetical protein
MSYEERIAHALASADEILADVALDNVVRQKVEHLDPDNDPARRHALTRALREFYRLGGQL